MPRLLYTVDDLVTNVRSQLDESNPDSVDTDEDILPSLNRGLDYAVDIYVRRYPEPFLQKTTLDLVSNQADYDMPENVFEDRIEKVEISINGTQREVQLVSYRDITNYESTPTANVPYYYTIFSRKIRFVPTPSGTYDARIWYIQLPEKLVLPQGRITSINTANNYVLVDSAGSSLTTEADQLGSYINVVDGQTGQIKGSLQIQIIDDNRITFRTSPQRTTVLNRTISTSLSSVGGIGLDDYLSPIDGTCVPYYSRPTVNFLIEYAVAEITRKLGGEAGMHEKVLEKFEKQVERTWAGREQSWRVKKRSQSWGVPTKRWYFL